MVGSPPIYRGRLAPSPTGRLHLGHARTFWLAWHRARTRQGRLVFRNEDLDPERSRPEFLAGIIRDLRWLGITWDEGPDPPGPHGPYHQSQRRELHRRALLHLQRQGLVYPCYCTRRDLRAAAQAPHAADDELIYPGTCRPSSRVRTPRPDRRPSWRFRVPAGESIRFVDGRLGPQHFIGGRDFGDFIVWRADDVPAYQLAVVVDDAAMSITEVVRGEDLLVSTARQILLYRALGLGPPWFYHCPLVRDEEGRRLSKRHHALSLEELARQGVDPERLTGQWSLPMAMPERAGEGAREGWGRG